MDTTLRKAEDQHRYEILVDGAVVGIADYREDGDTLVFAHTVVEPAWRGKGLAEQLVRFALDDARTHGKQIVPACWYVAEFVDTHPDYADLLA